MVTENQDVSDDCQVDLACLQWKGDQSVVLHLSHGADVFRFFFGLNKKMEIDSMVDLGNCIMYGT